MIFAVTVSIRTVINIKPEKEHALSTLMTYNKKELAERVYMLERNNNSLHETIDQQAENFIQITKDWRPVRRGKWIEACFDDGYDSAATCSLCEESTCFYGRCENDLPPFCSKCGAYMRGE